MEIFGRATDYINIVEEESRIKSPILFSYFPEFYGFKDFSEGSVVSMVREEEQTLTMVTKISDIFQLWLVNWNF